MFGIDPIELLTRMPVVLLALTVHEFAHAYTAYRLGDPTAYQLGRCSLNPLRHLDPIGTLCIMFAPIGWAKPVPVNPLNFRQPGRDDLLVSVAGPLSNIAQAMVWALVVRAFGGTEHLLTNLDNPLYVMLLLGVLVNVALAVFNMLPLFPLDGFHVMLHLLPSRSRAGFLKTQRYGLFVILGLILLPRFANIRFDPLRTIIGYPVGFVLQYVAGA